MFNFGLVLNSALGVKPTLVPFNSAGQATNALLGGQVDYMCVAILDVGPNVQAGTLKAYAIGAGWARHCRHPPKKPSSTATRSAPLMPL